MRKIPVGYGYSNTEFGLHDFADSRTKPLIVEYSGRRWRGYLHSLGDQFLLVLNDEQSLALDPSQISFVGDPIKP